MTPTRTAPMLVRLFAALLLIPLVAACDHGLVPPEEPPLGAIAGTVTYTGSWPPADSLVDLRFVALRFFPRDTTDFLQLNRLVFSPTRLRTGVERDTFFVGGVEAGTFVYSGVAQQYSPALFAWRPVGLYEAGGGLFQVRAGETTFVHVDVDFGDLPPFPPPAGAASVTD